VEPALVEDRDLIFVEPGHGLAGRRRTAARPRIVNARLQGDRHARQVLAAAGLERALLRGLVVAAVGHRAAGHRSHCHSQNSICQ
jgi:hypothetical protein